MSNRSLALVFVALFSAAGLMQGCGGSSSAKATPKCVLASDCASPLVCALGYCVAECNESRDCPNSELCVKLSSAATDGGLSGNACRAPEVASKTCALNSECATPLVCGRDLTCRTQCNADVDCLTGQKCTVSKTCADPTVDKDYNAATNDFNPPDAGAGTAGASGTAGTNGTAGTTGTAGATGSAGTVGTAGATGTAGTTGTAGSNQDGGAGATGTAGAMTDGGGMNPDTAEAVDMTTVTPNASVFQGQSGVTVTVTRSMGGLSNASVVSFGTLSATKAVVQSSSTDTSLVIKITIPHGAPLGMQTLVVSTKGGVITLTNVITVTPITASPLGSDSNAGSAPSPFRSVKQALLVADVGDTIHLVDGLYSSAPVAMGGSAETWGYTIPNNLTVTGDTVGGCILDGSGAPNTDAFDAQTLLSLSSMTLKHFRYGVYVNQPNAVVTLAHLGIITSQSSYAIYVDTAALGATVNLSGTDSLIDATAGYAIYVAGNSNSTNEKIVLNLNDGTIQATYYAIQLSNTSGTTLNLTNAKLNAIGGYSVIYVTQSSNVIGNSVIIKNSAITGTISMGDKNTTFSMTGGTMTQKSGVLMDLESGGMFSISGTVMTMSDTSNAINFAAPNASLTVTGATINGGGAAIAQGGAGSTAKLRNTELLSQQYYAYYLSNGNLDLGTATDAGGNGLGLPISSSYYTLYAQSSSSVITSSSTTYGDHLDAQNAVIHGGSPSAGTIMGPATRAPQIYNIATGSQITFF